MIISVSEQPEGRVADEVVEGRELLIRAAAALMQERVPSSISGRQVAAEAGVTYGLISHYWPGGVRRMFVDAYDRLQAAYVSRLTSDPETWIDRNEHAAPYFRASAFVSVDSDFLDTWAEHGRKTELPLDLLERMLPTVSRAEVAARWTVYLRARISYQMAVGNRATWFEPAWSERMSGAEMTRAQRYFHELGHRVMRVMLTAGPILAGSDRVDFAAVTAGGVSWVGEVKSTRDRLVHSRLRAREVFTPDEAAAVIELAELLRAEGFDRSGAEA